MTPEQFFVEQAKFNKWLFDLTSDEAKHILSMLNEYAEAKAKDAYNQGVRDADKKFNSYLPYSMKGEILKLLK